MTNFTNGFELPLESTPINPPSNFNGIDFDDYIAIERPRVALTAEEILKGASEQQMEIIKHKDGACLANAGAGVGKTHSVVQRLKYLVEVYNIPQENIYLISYTNKAVDEIKSRLGEDYSKCNVSTIHVMCNTVLRENRVFLNIADRFKLETAMKNCGIDEERIGDVKSFVGLNKNFNVRVDAQKYHTTGAFTGKQARFMYESYERALRSIGAFDFDDIILKCIDLLKSNEDLQNLYADKWKYIILDEANDTNVITDLAIALIGKHKNVMYCGDGKQAISMYRGSSPEIFLSFPERENSKILQLTKNYRSLPLIIYASNEFIKPHYLSTGFYEDSLCGRISEGLDGTIKINEVEVIEEIDRLVKEGEKPSNITVLYRLNKHSEPYELGLAIRGIPYTVKGGSGFFKQKDIKAIMGFIKLTQDEKDMQAFLDCYNTPTRYLGHKFIAEVDRILSKHDISIIKCLSYISDWHFSKGIQQIQFLHNGMKKLNKPSEMLDYFLRNSNYQKHIEKSTDEEGVKKEREELVKTLIKLVGEHDNFEELFTLQEKMLSENVEGVTLSTCHSYKGLENKIVFLVECEEGVFPDSRARGNEQAMLQETNLFYVGITRARDVLYVNGNSQFVEELEEILGEKPTNWKERV